MASPDYLVAWLTPTSHLPCPPPLFRYVPVPDRTVSRKLRMHFQQWHRTPLFTGRPSLYVCMLSTPDINGQIYLPSVVIYKGLWSSYRARPFFQQGGQDFTINITSQNHQVTYSTKSKCDNWNRSKGEKMMAFDCHHL